MEARESTVQLGFGRIGAAWTYARPTRIATEGSAIGPVSIRDYGMAVRIAVWSIVILFSIRRSSND
jgi:hypothetical protein